MTLLYYYQLTKKDIKNRIEQISIFAVKFVQYNNIKKKEKIKNNLNR